MKEIVFVTTNPGKMGEAKAIGAEYGISFVQDEYDVFEVQSNDLSEVAIECAKDAWPLVKRPMIVEDSGFFVNALKGFPGVYSAFVLKTIGNSGILRLLEGAKDRSSAMRSAVAYTDGKETKLFTGEVKGDVSECCKGTTGFGYDPIFIPQGSGKTFGEDFAYKNKVSHRAKSIRAFCEWYSKQ